MLLHADRIGLDAGKELESSNGLPDRHAAAVKRAATLTSCCAQEFVQVRDVYGQPTELDELTREHLELLQCDRFRRDLGVPRGTACARCVTKRDWPGRRLSIQTWMSASLRARRGGVPSTTQPIADPWLSPQLVNLKRVPKLLPAIDDHSPICDVLDVV